MPSPGLLPCNKPCQCFSEMVYTELLPNIRQLQVPNTGMCLDLVVNCATGFNLLDYQSTTPPNLTPSPVALKSQLEDLSFLYTAFGRNHGLWYWCQYRCQNWSSFSVVTLTSDRQTKRKCCLSFSYWTLALIICCTAEDMCGRMLRCV